MTNKKLGYNPMNTIPNNIVAKRVVYDSGDHYNPKVKSNKHLFCTECPSLRKITSLPNKIKSDPSFKDLTGLKKGYFTIIGILDCHDYNKWVLKCVCGNYEVRTTTTFNKIKDQVDQNRCQSCVDLERIRNKDYWKKNGIYPWQVRKK